MADERDREGEEGPVETASGAPEGEPLQSSAEATRQALIEAAIEGFGKSGFSATSTRSIAAAAGANIASIAYHFGGKEGLRRACGEAIRNILQSVIRLTLDGETPEHYAGLTQDEARARMLATLERMASFVLTHPRANLVVPFMLREIFSPSVAFDIIYAGVIEPSHRRMCALWSAATGEPAESPETRLLLFSMVGQVLFFRIAREAILRRLGWEAIGPGEADLIRSILARNVEDLLEAHAKERS